MVYGILQARILEWGAFLFSRNLPSPGIEPRSPTLQVDSFPTEPLGKPESLSTRALQWAGGSSRDPYCSPLGINAGACCHVGRRRKNGGGS